MEDSVATTFKIAMIGDASTVAGFAAGGVEGFAQDPDDPVQALGVLNDLVRSGQYAIVFITEQLAEPLFESIERIETGAVPAIIIVPDQSGTRGIGYERIRHAVERAIGIDLLGAS
jgi:V/A-type H+-transporting ATPase subunit F